MHGRWLPCGYLFRKRASGSRNTKPHKGNKQKAHGLSPTFSRRNLTFVTFLGEFTFLGPRPEPDPLPEELSESATRVSDSVCLRCQRRAGTHTIKALAEVCEVETSALEYSRNGMTKSASSLSLKLQVSAERCAQASAATYLTLAAVLLLFRKSQRLRKTETPQRKKTTGPRPEPDHLLEEPTFVTFLRG